MAPKIKDIKKYYDDLGKLFQSGAPVRRKIANKIAAPGDFGVPVGTARAFLKHVNNAYASTIASYGQYNRLARYSDYNEMESMAEIGGALDIYSEEVCTKDEAGEMLKVHSNNAEIKHALLELFYNTLNIEFNAWLWIRNLCKYGDQFLLIDHHPDYGILNALPMPINEVEREEGYDPENPLAYRFRWITQGNRVLENWQVVHFRLIANDNFLPYGSSILEPARRTWRQLILMEDAVMVYRIVRSPERRVFYIDIGNIAPQDVPAFMEKAKTQLKRNQIVDTNTGRVDLRYNPMSTDEDYFIPIRGEHSSRIETLPGGQFTGDIDDLVYIQNKLFAALKIPKSYLGYEQDINAKSTLSQEDVRFARTIQRIQMIFAKELNRIAIIHLYSMGYRGSDLINFEIGMANPSTIAELQHLELYRTRFEVASIAQEGFFDKHFIYKKIFKLNQKDIEGIEEGRKKDRMSDLEIENMQPPVPAGTTEEPGMAAAPGAEAPPPPEAAPPPEASPGPEAGLPPPPGEETPITAGAEPEGNIVSDDRDPNIQMAGPNDLLKAFPGQKRKRKLMPDLHKHAFGDKKTARDPKRNQSELTRMVRAPFGEDVEIDEDDFESREERHFNLSAQKLRKFAEDLEKSPILQKVLSEKKKKVLNG